MVHGDLAGLDADDHPHYTQRAQDEIVTGDWMFTHLQDRSAGWLFLPDDKIFKAVPHNMIFKATADEASLGIGAYTGSPSEYAIYLYDDDSNSIFMDNETYDQVSISNELIGDDKRFLLEGTVVKILFHKTDPISIELPTTLDFKVTEAEPAVEATLPGI